MTAVPRLDEEVRVHVVAALNAYITEERAHNRTLLPLGLYGFREALLSASPVVSGGHQHQVLATAANGGQPGVVKNALTIAETATYLGESVSTVRRRCRAGALPHIRDGAVIRVLAGDLADYVKEHRRA